MFYLFVNSTFIPRLLSALFPHIRTPYLPPTPQVMVIFAFGLAFVSSSTIAGLNAGIVFASIGIVVIVYAYLMFIHRARAITNKMQVRRRWLMGGVLFASVLLARVWMTKICPKYLVAFFPRVDFQFLKIVPQQSLPLFL
jgi:hypothetical protein